MSDDLNENELLNKKREFKNSIDILPRSLQTTVTVQLIKKNYDLFPKVDSTQELTDEKSEEEFQHNLEELTGQAKLDALHREKYNLIKEIENISSEINTFEQREKRDLLIDLMDKIADNIDESKFEIEDLKEQLLFGCPLQNLIDKFNKEINDSNLKKFDEINRKSYDFTKIRLNEKKMKRIKIKKNKQKKSKIFKKVCYSCFKKDGLFDCQNCPAAYHTYCESFKAVFNIEKKVNLIICNDCFNFYKDSNKILKEQQALYDNCENQINSNDLKLNYRCPKFYNYQIETETETNEKKNQMKILAERIITNYRKIK